MGGATVVAMLIGQHQHLQVCKGRLAPELNTLQGALDPPPVGSRPRQGGAAHVARIVANDIFGLPGALPIALPTPPPL